jgi:hypothetical protein
LAGNNPHESGANYCTAGNRRLILHQIHFWRRQLPL